MSSTAWGSDKTKKQKQWEEGRVCTKDGCTTVLSIYNPSTRCSVHAPKVGQR